MRARLLGCASLPKGLGNSGGFWSNGGWPPVAGCSQVSFSQHWARVSTFLSAPLGFRIQKATSEVVLMNT